VPFADDLVENADDKALLEAAEAPLAFGRPFVLPPNVPVDRVELLRRALEDICKDPDFLAEAAKEHLDITPETGEELQAILARTYASSPTVIARLKSLAEAQTQN
jgi:tripartite-type tricarboxylate transporter receptor subunit TctC